MKPSLQIAFITGRSHPDCWRLSPKQSAFLEKLDLASAQPVKVNFPWQESAAHDYQSMGLLRASVNNAREYLRSRQRDFVRRYQPRR